MPAYKQTLDMQQWAKYLVKLGPGFYKAALTGARITAMRAVGDLQRATSVAPPASRNGGQGAMNTGQFKLSWKWSADETSATVYNSAPYAAVIEEGRRPGTFPPIGPIEKWAMRRLGVPKNEARGVAFAIGRAIKKRGLWGRHILKNYLPTLKANFAAALKAEFQKAAGGK